MPIAQCCNTKEFTIKFHLYLDWCVYLSENEEKKTKSMEPVASVELFDLGTFWEWKAIDGRKKKDLSEIDMSETSTHGWALLFIMRGTLNRRVGGTCKLSAPD